MAGTCRKVGPRTPGPIRRRGVKRQRSTLSSHSLPTVQSICRRCAGPRRSRLMQAGLGIGKGELSPRHQRAAVGAPVSDRGGLLGPGRLARWPRAAAREPGYRLRVPARARLPEVRVDLRRTPDLVDEYLPCCETVAIPDPRPAVPECRDPFDRPFLELALVGRADALVTGDADLLALADIFPTPILAPAVLKERLHSAESVDRQ